MTMTERQRGEGELQDFAIVGVGEIGDKARELMRKTPALKAMGFCVPYRTILAGSFLDHYLLHNRLGPSLTTVDGSPEIQEKIAKGKFSPQDTRVFAELAQKHHGWPLMVRSSAASHDARGTGIYTSVSVNGTTQDIGKGVKKVWESYFSPPALAFRRDTQGQPGLGIIIEPLIGNQLSHNYVAPVFSGFGYTTTPQGEGYINIVPGIGGGVDTRHGERLTRTTLQPYDGKLMRYQYQENLAMAAGIKKIRNSDLLGSYHYGFMQGTMFLTKGVGLGELYHRQMEYGPEIEAVLDSLNLFPLFDRMEQMEATFHHPQYFEWAMTFADGSPLYWITQIADVKETVDTVDFHNHGEPLFTAHSVTGTGIRHCTTIVDATEARSADTIAAFNATHEGYVLIYTSWLTSMSADRGRGKKLQYHHLNNASVILELTDTPHNANPISHFSGQLEETGKLFGVITDDDVENQGWRLFDLEEQNPLHIYEGELTAVSSEKHNRLTVYQANK